MPGARSRDNFSPAKRFCTVQTVRPPCWRDWGLEGDVHLPHQGYLNLNFILEDEPGQGPLDLLIPLHNASKLHKSPLSDFPNRCVTIDYWVSVLRDFRA